MKADATQAELLKRILQALTDRLDSIEDRIDELRSSKANLTGLIEIAGDLPVAGLYEIENL